MKIKFNVKEMVESAMLIALAVILDIKGLKIQMWPDGGSISFTMVPLIVLAIRLGPAKGFVCIGIIYGLITCLLDGWGIQTYPFDYLLAYGSLSVVGFFRNTILDSKHKKFGFFILVLSVLLALILRFIFATISGVVIYEIGLVESMAYNFAYLSLGGAATLVVMAILYKPLIVINDKFPLKSID